MERRVRVVNQSKGTLLGDDVEIADSSWTRLVGLLGRRKLGPGGGLLIVPSNGVHTVGMRFAIDVVFFNKENRVVGVRDDMKPFRLTGLNWKAKGVLELPSGTIVGTKTEANDLLVIEPV